MPGGDGTGPLGFGPMSGWGRGFCGLGTQPYGARGCGRGLGRRRGFFSPVPTEMTQETGADILKNRARYLECELKAVNDRLAKLSPSEPKE